MDLESSQILVGYPHKLGAITALVYITGRTSLWIKGLVTDCVGVYLPPMLACRVLSQPRRLHKSVKALTPDQLLHAGS